MRRITSLARVTVPALAVVLLAGCGTSGPRPGTALSIDGHTVSTAHVDDVATRYCAALTKVGVDKPLPASAVRSQVVSALAARLAADRYAAAEGLTPGPAYAQEVATLRPQLSSFSEKTQDAIIDVEGATTYVGSIVGTSGEQGLSSWLEKQDVVVNPVYGLRLRGAQILPVDGSVSVARSRTAKAAVKASGDLSGDSVAPDGRTCG